jgi:hypothetical protein
MRGHFRTVSGTPSRRTRHSEVVKSSPDSKRIVRDWLEPYLDRPVEGSVRQGQILRQRGSSRGLLQIAVQLIADVELNGQLLGQVVADEQIELTILRGFIAGRTSNAALADLNRAKSRPCQSHHAKTHRQGADLRSDWPRHPRMSWCISGTLRHATLAQVFKGRVNNGQTARLDDGPQHLCRLKR